MPQISRVQGQFVKSDKIAKKLSKMLIWASKIKFRKISKINFKNDSQFQILTKFLNFYFKKSILAVKFGLN